MQQALEIRTRLLGHSHRQVASSLTTLGWLLNTSGKRRLAFQSFQQALEIRQEILGSQHLETAKAKTSLAIVTIGLSRYDEATRLLKEALTVQNLILGADDVRLAETYLALSATYMGQGNLAMALPAAIDACQRFELGKGRKSGEYAYALGLLHSLYDLMGEDKKATETLLKYKNIVMEIFKPTDLVYLDCEILVARWASEHKNTRERAGPLYERLLANIREAKLERTSRYARALTGYGELLQSLHEYARSQEFYREAIELRLQIQEKPESIEIANCHLKLGLVSLSLGELAAAKTHFDTTYQMTRRLVGEKSHLLANSLYQLARVEALQQHHEAAHEHLMASLKIEQLALNEKFLLGSDHAIAKVLDSGAGKYALLLTLQAAKRSPPETVESAYRWTLQRKGRALDMACRMQTAKRSLAHQPEIVKTLSEIQSLRRSLTETTIAGTGYKSEASSTPNRELYLKRIAELQQQLALRVRDAGVGALQTRIDVAKIRSRLPHDSALIEFVVASLVDLDSSSDPWTPRHVLAFYVPAGIGASCRFVDLGPAAEIKQLIQQMRTHIERLPRSIRLTSEADLERQFQSLSTTLYQRLLGPFEQELTNIKSLVLAPDSDLHRVPFSALCQSNGRYLIEDFTVGYVSSGRDLLRDHATPGSGSLILADPNYNASGSERAAVAATLNYRYPNKPMQLALRSGKSDELRSLRWRSLPGARQEAEEIRLLLKKSIYLPVQSYVGEKAVEEVLKSTISPRLIHIATHGFYVPYQKANVSQSLQRGGASSSGLGRLRRDVNPLLRSGIVLAGANQLTRGNSENVHVDDGWVTAQEIASMDFRNTELIVLSACESGLGEVKSGHGVHGLRRALLIAGAHNVLTSLFEVPDSETRELMEGFYQALVARGQPATALRDTQRAMIKKRRNSHNAAHPFYWASFFVLGKQTDTIDPPSQPVPSVPGRELLLK